MSLIEFPVGRAAAPGYQQCECGSAWFRLERSSGSGDVVAGVVSVDEHGTVTGYSGRLVCNDCGRAR